MEKDVLQNMTPGERTSYEVSRRKALGIAAKLGLGGAAAAAAIGGGGLRGSSLREALAAGGLPQKDYKFTFVNHVTTNPFFTPTQYGIEDACAFFGCSVSVDRLADLHGHRDGLCHADGDRRQGRMVSRSAWSTPRRSISQPMMRSASASR